MLPALVALLLSPFTTPQPWALGFAAPPRLPFAGDVDGDGLADMIVVFPEGDTILDVALTVEGAKSGTGAQGLPRWDGATVAATVGEFDGTKGTDVAAIIDGRIRIAGGFRDGRFKDLSDKIVLPAVSRPALATVGRDLLVFSTAGGAAFRIDPRTRDTTPVRLPGAYVWIGDAGTALAAQDKGGNVFRLDPQTLAAEKIGTAPKGSRPSAGKGWIAFGDRVWTADGIHTLPASGLPAADSVRDSGDFDGDGDDDLLEFRRGKEGHTGNEALLRRFVSPGETDADHDGLPNEEEARRGTDPLDPDTDHDGLLDGWETGGIRGLDLKSLGCDPRHADVVCLVTRFGSVAKPRYETEMARVERFYRELPAKNPDGKGGIHFARVDLEAPPKDAETLSWQANLARFRPEKWRGIVHWMQVTPGGGGQADELGDGGTCGEDALWAVFTHEFGHQLGLNHEGFWPNGSCPIYSSMMNYNYSYGFENDREKIHYSDGSLAGYTLREDDLDETIPFPYERVKFLGMGPYNYRLKPNGATTLIDWNWNGVFGERHIRADINYAYSTGAGPRDTVAKTSVSPFLFVHSKEAYLLSGVTNLPRVPGGDPTLSSARTGSLVMRKLQRPLVWEQPWTAADDLAGDPVGASLEKTGIFVAYPTPEGIALRLLDPWQRASKEFGPTIQGAGLVPTMGERDGRPVLMVWNPHDGSIMAWEVTGKGLGARLRIDATSTNPPGMCTDTKTGETILALAQDQGAARPNRWQIRRFGPDMKETGMEWVEGPEGQARGVGRLTVLFDGGRDAGPKGRLYLFGKGMTDAKTPWSCTYVAQSIADKTVRGGWLVKRYYDEWTQSRSAPTAAWFRGDVIWAYRWVGGDGPSDDDLQVGYRALGIQSEPFGDFDDVGFVRDFGLAHSLLSLGRR